MGNMARPTDGRAEAGAETASPHELDRPPSGREEFLRRMADAMPMLVAYVDLESRYRFCNRAYTRRFGFQLEEIYGRTIADVLGVLRRRLIRNESR